jgi:hypothetical protein
MSLKGCKSWDRNGGALFHNAEQILAYDFSDAASGEVRHLIRHLPACSKRAKTYAQRLAIISSRGPNSAAAPKDLTLTDQGHTVGRLVVRLKF